MRLPSARGLVPSVPVASGSYPSFRMKTLKHTFDTAPPIAGE
jgi:hypothetical protein